MWQDWQAAQHGRPPRASRSRGDGRTTRNGGWTGRGDGASRDGRSRSMFENWLAGGTPGEQGPWPADLPSSGDAGLAAQGYGVSAEGELTEAELARSWFRPLPAGHQRAQPPVPGPGQPWQTMPIEQPVTGAAGSTAPAGDAGSPGLVRSSAVMAVGTLASRVTGMLRTIVLVPALGAYGLGDAYNVANTLPNTVYNLAIGGILTSVIVPLLVSASKRDVDRGENYTQRMFTLVTVILAAVTIIATAASDPIATLFGCTSKTCAGTPAAADYRHLLIIFSYFFIPQIFFYGVSSLAGAVLNARGHFAAPMWTPVINNIVVIVVTVTFMIIAGVFSGGHPTATTVTPLEVQLLGLGTTLGIVAQTVALIPSLRRVGFRWRPRFDFRRIDVSEIGRMAGWMFAYILTTQVAFFVAVKVADHANRSGQTSGRGAGFAAYANAWMLFQLPYAIVAISVITALLPRMSANATDRRYDLVRSDFSTGVRLGSAIVAPAALILAVLGPSLATMLFAWGNTNLASATYFGFVFSVFSLGLVPYMLFQLQLRVFYALHDSKTPAFVGVATMIVGIAANLIALATVPQRDVVAALGVGFGLANLVGTLLAWRLLSRRLGGLAGHEIGRSLARMHAAAVPAALFALIITGIVHAAFPAGKASAVLILFFGGAGALALYLVFARLLRVSEVTDLIGMVRTRLRR